MFRFVGGGVGVLRDDFITDGIPVLLVTKRTSTSCKPFVAVGKRHQIMNLFDGHFLLRRKRSTRMATIRSEPERLLNVGSKTEQVSPGSKY